MCARDVSRAACDAAAGPPPTVSFCAGAGKPGALPARDVALADGVKDGELGADDVRLVELLQGLGVAVLAGQRDPPRVVGARRLARVVRARAGRDPQHPHGAEGEVADSHRRGLSSKRVTISSTLPVATPTDEGAEV